MTAIVLAGHGSTVSPETGGLVRRAADILREWRVADEATAAFWKERPGFSEVADTLQSDKMIVVPVFAARGWYTDVVLPRELAKGRKDVEYVVTPPIGEHPRTAELVEEAAKAGVLSSTSPRNPECSVIVIGHGTPKHPGSRDTTFAIVERLRQEQLAPEVEAAFLDDEPTIAAAVEACTAPTLVIVTNFIAAGGHVGDDVPDEVAKALAARSRPTPRRMYSRPRLTAEEIAGMARDLTAHAD